jgi:hypothetical protein
MLKKLILNRLSAMEHDLGYDATYVREVLDTDMSAFLRFAPLSSFSTYCRDLPAEVWHASKVAGALSQDCGPCTQLMVTLAERAGVSADTLRAVLRGDDAALAPDVRLGVAFVRSVLARDESADALREQVLARWGRRALVTLSFAIVSARVYPTLKYALGYGRACTRVVVAGAAVAPRHAGTGTIGAVA